MAVRAIFVAVLLTMSQLCVAQLVTVMNAVETSPANIILPADTDGMMTFRPCAGECDDDYIRVRLSADSKFSVDGEAVKYADFRREVAIIKRDKSSYALVMYETETNTVTSIEIAG